MPILLEPKHTVGDRTLPIALGLVHFRTGLDRDIRSISARCRLAPINPSFRNGLRTNQQKVGEKTSKTAS